MHYLLSVIDDPTTAASADEPDPTDDLQGRLRADGHFVFAGALAAPMTATVVDNRHERPVVTDGPFLESKEYLGGFFIIEAPDLDVALRIAADASKWCSRRVEVRACDELTA